MRAVVWFRIAAALMVLFAAGHTVGFLTFRPSSAEGRAVWAAMNGVYFTDGHASFSYGGFFVGFGLSITAAMVFTAWLLWTLGSWAGKQPAVTRSVAWAIFAWQMVGVVLSVRYFSTAPTVFSVLEAICVGLGAACTRTSNPVQL